ncbi:MAG TPA: DUF1800 family protein, partial [Planctomycetaceae bacterium]|nr:DUF1800 family protein [Planctomycetaceae bacterium]
ALQLAATIEENFGIHVDRYLVVGAEANRKAMPNDQLARHLLERLTVGPGHFRGEDVREAARALTGWFVLRGRLRFIAREHDPGVKTILGQQGRWGRDDVVRIVLKPPAAARLLVRKLYRWFVSEADEPDDTLLEPLVERLAHSYDVRWVVETILRSNWFFSPMAYRRRGKSPVEFALGIVRGLEGMVGTVELGAQLAALGQDLCRPPTLDGWQGGRWWLNSATMIGRGRLAAALLSDEEPYSGRLDPLAVARSYGHHGREAAVKFLIDLFLQQDLDGLAGPQVAAGGPADADPAAGVRRAAHRIFTLPEFQLA